MPRDRLQSAARVEERMGACLGPLAGVGADVGELALANAMSGAAAPLTMAWLAPSDAALDPLLAELSTALFGAAHAPQRLDLDMAALRSGSDSVRRTKIKDALVAHVAAHPARSLVVLRGLDELQASQVSVLDVLLDPMNADQPRIVLPAGYTHGSGAHVGEVYTSGAVFVLGFAADERMLRSQYPLDDWLEGRWEADGPAHDFTTSALVGRINGHVRVPPLSAVEQARVRKAQGSAACLGLSASGASVAAAGAGDAAVVSFVGAAVLAAVLLLGLFALVWKSAAPAGAGAVPAPAPAPAPKKKGKKLPVQLDGQGAGSGSGSGSGSGEVEGEVDSDSEAEAVPRRRTRRRTPRED